MSSVVVTTSRKQGDRWEEMARQIARAIRGVYVPREGRTLAQLTGEGSIVVTVGPLGMRIHTPSGELFYHPGMGRPRIRRIEQGGTDPMVTAMGLRPGDQVLDCTLGLGSDAIVASYVVGDRGYVEGWESVPLLAELTRRGMAAYEDDHPAIVAAMRRVVVFNRDYKLHLRHVPDGAFDVVYFDPMFREPVWQSTPFLPLRHLVDERPLNKEAVQEALRIARRVVVVKERRDSPVFAELGASRIVGGKGSRIAYGVFSVKGVR